MTGKKTVENQLEKMGQFSMREKKCRLLAQWSVLIQFSKRGMNITIFKAQCARPKHMSLRSLEKRIGSSPLP